MFLILEVNTKNIPNFDKVVIDCNESYKQSFEYHWNIEKTFISIYDKIDNNYQGVFQLGFCLSHHLYHNILTIEEIKHSIHFQISTLNDVPGFFLMAYSKQCFFSSMGKINDLYLCEINWLSIMASDGGFQAKIDGKNCNFESIFMFGYVLDSCGRESYERTMQKLNSMH
jgi:hypothetical protein